MLTPSEKTEEATESQHPEAPPPQPWNLAAGPIPSLSLSSWRPIQALTIKRLPGPSLLGALLDSGGQEHSEPEPMEVDT
jgi:hypothetical protein